MDNFYPQRRKRIMIFVRHIPYKFAYPCNLRWLLCANVWKCSCIICYEICLYLLNHEWATTSFTFVLLKTGKKLGEWRNILVWEYTCFVKEDGYNHFQTFCITGRLFRHFPRSKLQGANSETMEWLKSFYCQ